MCIINLFQLINKLVLPKVRLSFYSNDLREKWKRVKVKFGAITQGEHSTLEECGGGGRSNNRSFVAKALSQHFSFRRADKISYTLSFSHTQCLRIVIRGCATEYVSPRIEELVGTLVRNRRVNPTNYVESKHKLRMKEWLNNSSLQWLELLQLLKQNSWIPKIGSANCLALLPVFGLRPHPTHCIL